MNKLQAKEQLEKLSPGAVLVLKIMERIEPAQQNVPIESIHELIAIGLGSHQINILSESDERLFVLTAKGKKVARAIEMNLTR